MFRKTRLQVDSLDQRCLPSFSPATSYAVGTNPRAVITADFNNDSILDVAVANTGTGTVSVLVGNANGTFQAAITSPTGNQPSSLAVGDFNADGKLDIAAADESYNSPDLAVLLGNGNGKFGAPTGYDASYFNGVSTLAVGDFNTDGKLDISVVSYYSDGGSGFDDSYVGVMLGTGLGTFYETAGWAALSSGLATYHDSVAADFNGDGDLDLAAPSDSGYVSVVLGYGDGSFPPATVYYVSSGVSSIVAGDVNADGKLDLVAAGDSSVSVMFGNGNGSFGATQNYSASTSSINDLAVAEFNGDGNLDLIVSNSSDGTVGVLLGTGTGAFAPPVSNAVGTGPIGVAVGDFNGDSKTDTVSANYLSGNVSVLLNDGVWPPNSRSVRIDDVSVAEGNIGTRSVTFTVSLSAAAAQTMSVAYTTANGTAAAGSDFQAASGALTFAPGEISKTITVLVNGDRLGEAHESFVVNLGNATNAIIVDGQGVCEILDDEPRISISDVTKYEGKNNQTTLFTFTVALSVAYDQPVSMSFQTVNGTAKSGEDFVSRAGTLTFAPGETTKTITVEVKGDKKRESNEYFYLDLFGNSGNSLFTNNRGIGTILNDD